ncbi:hypothetical protein [Roseofilum casamattae]|uniref:Uncharacterized protein n=1 Tax=Roseofilum casamattae BLCC-M143 TaxID=3022442 RepID=A0ABT7BVW0_9CYAN|nr:hypothetical protein [Roseofilum casamattae]MDJ1183329.1 hypothetical protein [Roseofilum casamattae BLCC-M143]
MSDCSLDLSLASIGLPQLWLPINEMAQLPPAALPMQNAMVSVVALFGLIISSVMYFRAYGISRVPVLIKPQGRSQKSLDAFWYPYKGTAPYRMSWQYTYWGSLCLISSLTLIIAAVSPIAYAGLTVVVAIGCLLTFICFVFLNAHLAEILLWCTSLIAWPLVLVLVQSVVGAPVFAALAAGLFSALIALPLSTTVMKRLRSHPNFWCATCKKPLKAMPPQQLSDYLTVSDRLAQQQGRTIFEGLECLNCSYPNDCNGIHLRAYIRPSLPSVPRLPAARPLTWQQRLMTAINRRVHY